MKITLSVHGDFSDYCVIFCLLILSEVHASATANGVDLYYEKVGGGDHAVLLLPGALGEFYCK